jgi:hypothetical protein
MSEKEGFQVDDFLPQLGNLRRQGIVLSTEHFDLGLKISQPLLLSLTTLESRDTKVN